MTAASVLIVVTHLLGSGHLARAAVLGRGLARAGHRVTLVTGGRPVPLIRTDGLSLVQLPSVHCRGVDFTTLLGDDGRPVTEALRRERIGRLLAALAEAGPDVVITETYPFGRRQLAAEFNALLEDASVRTRRPAVLASIRDILNPPSRPSKAVEALAVLGRHYDGVLVHGDEAVTPLAASWPTDPSLEQRLVYTGYVAEPSAAPDAAAAAAEEAEILVSGGGSAASLPLFRAALAAAALDPAPPWRILVGHGVPDEDFWALRRAAGAALVERARPDFPDLLARCAASVSQAGYNTVVDLLQARAPAVLVPFEEGREAEQRLRAECFAGHGLAEVVAEAELSAGTLAAAVARARRRGRPDAVPVRLDGIARSIGAVDAAAGAAVRRRRAWARLDAALAGAEAEGRTLTLWWRDDDAIAATPALDRLLRLADAVEAPLALAVIPSPCEPALAGALADHPRVDVLVHGWSHRNHAPPGAKKVELGHRPAAEVVADLRRGLERIASLFGPQHLPVLVPPWNRVDGTVVGALAGAGYAGLSTFGPRPAARADGLRLANTHLDPIDWHGGRGLGDETELIERLAFLVTAAPPEPVGLLTHHLVHDEWVWSALERLLHRLRDAAAVRFVSARSIFASETGLQ